RAASAGGPGGAGVQGVPGPVMPPGVVGPMGVSGHAYTPAHGAMEAGLPGALGPPGAPAPAGTGAYPIGQPSVSLAEAVQSAHDEGQEFGASVARDAPALWLEAVPARKPRLPSPPSARPLPGPAPP